MQILISCADTSTISVGVHFPEDYPSHSPPFADFGGRYLSPDQASELQDKLDILFQKGNQQLPQSIQKQIMKALLIYERSKHLLHCYDDLPHLQDALATLELCL